MAYTALVTYFVNLVLDYSMQSPFLFQYKARNLYILFVHSTIWGLGISIVLHHFALFAWWKVFFLILGHMLIDYIKSKELYRPQADRNRPYRTLDRRDFLAIYADQFLHIAQLAIVLLLP